LAEELTDLDRTLASLADADWLRATPFKGWTVFDHVHHLNLSDDLAAFAARDPEGFRARPRPPVSASPLDGRGPDGSPAMPPAALLARWREDGRLLLQAFRALGPSDRLPWFGPDLSARSFITARQMETWAHGQTIHDTLGRRRIPTDRIRAICELGWRTKGWSFVVHGLTPPDAEIALRLESPSGALWTWGVDQADNRIEGRAEDFALVVCQCRNIADTRLKVSGEAAAAWMAVAQCFAGGPATPPAPGERVVAWGD
jgi:uncharacterized protein (TIGR03084 family)